jgi:AraC-like DNA-binding protein
LPQAASAKTAAAASAANFPALTVRDIDSPRLIRAVAPTAPESARSYVAASGVVVQNPTGSCISCHRARFQAPLYMLRDRRKNAGHRPIRDYVIRVGGANALIPLLSERGVDAERLLNEVGLSTRMFDNPDNVVPFAALCRALQLAVERTGLADFGIRGGMRADLRSLGLLGYLIANSDTVGRGLQALREFLHVHDQGAAPFLIEEEGVAMLGYEVLDPGIAGAEQMTFGALAIAANILRTLCGPRFELRAVTFSFRSPANSALFRKFFKSPVRFNAERSALAFDARWLQERITGADPYIREILDAKLKDAGAMRGESFENRIRRVVRTLLAAGRCAEEDAAKAFGMSRRSLARRLKNSGSTFRAVVDAARFDVARSLLESSQITIVEIAARLGYADSSTFARAFRRWSGTSPALWRGGRRTL